MTDFGRLLQRLKVDGPLSVDERSVPLGTAWLAHRQLGIDLATHGYEELEFIVSGLADAWTWDPDLRAVSLGARPFSTRVLVRRPIEPARFSGAVQLEPHHPDEDRALTWGMIAPWVVRCGHAHVGVTQHPPTVADLVAWDPERYSQLSIPDSTQRWDIVGLLAAGIATGAVPAFADLAVKRTLLSGWSMTGTFCRTFLGEGFHDRCRVDGAAVIDGYVICISSGGAGRPGYASLGNGRVLPLGDRRRTIGVYGVPVVELLSEAESETQRDVLRPDADGPDDLYRLYQIAGTGHVITGRRSPATNRAQMRERGFATPPREINEMPSDARMDLVTQALFAAVDRWVADGVAPPRTERFRYDARSSAGVRGRMPESLPLERDVDGNVVGGIRAPWVGVPFATYLPHSTPRPGRCEPSAHAPYSDPALVADLVAHMEPFPVPELKRRYGNSRSYMGRFEQAARTLAGTGCLLADDLPELLASHRESCGDW